MSKKTAILLRGLSRHHINTYKHLLNNIPNSDVFIFTWDITGRRLSNNRFDYSYEDANIENIKQCYNPKKIKVENYDNFLEKNQELIINNTRQLGFDIDSSELGPQILNHSLHSLHSQMYGFEQVVKLFLETDLTEYEDILVTRFDFVLQRPLPKSIPNIVLANDRWHGQYYKDFAHVLNIQDISKYQHIYSSLFTNEFGYEQIRSPFKLWKTCAEIYYENYAIKQGLQCKNGNLGSNLLR